jgi:hypothetical protein
MVGMQKVWSANRASFYVLHAELLNTRITHLQLARPNPAFYVHDPIAQGHTELGQVLGSAGANGGGASSLGVDRYARTGKWTVVWDRLARGQRLSDNGPPSARSTDMMHSLTVRRLSYGRWVDLTTWMTATRDLNRNFQGDAGNIQLGLGARGHW